MLQGFKAYFNPILKHLISVIHTGIDNVQLTFISAVMIASVEIISKIWQIDMFGVPNLLLAIVVVTVAFNTIFGIRKSRLKRKKAIKCAKNFRKTGKDEEKYKKCRKIFKENKFDSKKFSFVYFKVLSLLAYLFFARTLLDTDADNYLEEVLNFTSGLILKVPTAWFWYHEWKSIGQNASIIYGKKPQIFDITEEIFEAKFMRATK